MLDSASIMIPMTYDPACEMSVSFWPFFGLVEAPKRNDAVGRPSSSVGASE
jgi:hypothetical protein